MGPTHLSIPTRPLNPKIGYKNWNRVYISERLCINSIFNKVWRPIQKKKGNTENFQVILVLIV